ncbi:MAG: tRNA glutamyl-Q(34) synthetase GluQRS [Burkholderiales bacterium]|nr:tRNA glutamyl-Q(34) synthetase GluQRS [Burkholderiales bacterium]
MSAYRGRFAPSPTGPLHFGSLVAAVASFVDARAQGGSWLVRMEDLDPPRVVPGAADDILRTLEAFGLHWDETVVYQSARHAAYEAALQRLEARGAIFPCACTRKEIADSALGPDGTPIYPGTCRNGLPPGKTGRAIRVRVDDAVIRFVDRLQGEVVQELARSVGDFVVRRADGVYAYQLAVVVDDAWQGVTDVVRGADLLDSTPRQIHLQRLLDLPTPRYLHVPVATNARGEKLSKQTLAAPVDAKRPGCGLTAALDFLGHPVPDALRGAPPADILDWAVAHWNPAALPRARHLPISEAA